MFHFKGAFTAANLVQPSTIAAFVRIAVSLGLIHLTPDQEQQATNAMLHLIGAITEIIAYGQIVLALIGFFKKDARGDTIVTSAPVTITAPTEITTNPKG